MLILRCGASNVGFGQAKCKNEKAKYARFSGCGGTALRAPTPEGPDGRGASPALAVTYH